MRRPSKLRVALATTLAALGVGVAVAVADVTTSVATQCATTTSQLHTVNVDGVGVKTVGGDPLSVCATATATATNSTVTVTTTVPASNPLLFDGRAKIMNSLTRVGPAPDNGSQDPVVWDCLCFTHNDISLVADPRYTKAYNVAVHTGDGNGFGGTDPTYGAGQLSTRRTTNDLGKTFYYALAVKVPSWNGPIGDLFFVDLASFGYQTSEGDQVALQLWNGPNDAGPLQFAVQENAGFVNAPNGYSPGATNYETAFMNVTFGQWEDFVVAVRETTDNTGFVQVYHRSSTGWSQVFDKENVATELYGTIGSTNYAADGSNWTVIDKIGLYFKEYGGESETVQESGLTRSSDLATAESSLP